MGFRQPHDFNAYFNTLEAIMALREIEDNATLSQLSRETLVLAEKFARSFPFARARYLTWKALADWLDGNDNQAIKLWRQAIDDAIRLNMPYDTGLACYQLGLHLPSGDSQHTLRLKQALDLFEQCGAVWDLAQAETALG